MAALAFIVLLVLVAIFAPLIVKAVGAPDPNVQDPNALDDFGLPAGPSAEHIFGVDQIGRDVFARTIYGARVSLTVALIATALIVIDRHRGRHGRRLLPRLDRLRALADHGRPARVPGAAARARPRRRVLARRRLPRRHHRAGPARRDLRDRARPVALLRPHHPRAGPVAAREGVHRGGPLARRLEHPHHLPRDPPQPAGSDHRLHDADHPDQHPVRGGAVVPRRRGPAPDRHLGRDDRRRHQHLRHRLVVHARSRHRAGAHRAGVQPRGRRAPGCAQPQRATGRDRPLSLRDVSPHRKDHAHAQSALERAAHRPDRHPRARRRRLRRLRRRGRRLRRHRRRAPSEGKQGGDLTFLAAADVDYLDPGQSYYTFGYQVLYSTNRPLYSFAPGDDKQQPDLADGEPQISDGQEDHHVKIKTGIKYAPPVDREVKSTDVKYAIERAFSANVPSATRPPTSATSSALPTSRPRASRTIAGIDAPTTRRSIIKLDRPSPSPSRRRSSCRSRCRSRRSTRRSTTRSPVRVRPVRRLHRPVHGQERPEHRQGDRP